MAIKSPPPTRAPTHHPPVEFYEYNFIFPNLPLTFAAYFMWLKSSRINFGVKT